MSLRAKAGWIICVLMLGQARGVAGQNIEPLMWDIAGFARATHYRARSGLESWDWGGGARVSMRAGTLPIMLQAGYSFGYADFEEPLLHRRRAKHAMIDVAAVALL